MILTKEFTDPKPMNAFFQDLRWNDLDRTAIISITPYAIAGSEYEGLGSRSYYLVVLDVPTAHFDHLQEMDAWRYTPPPAPPRHCENCNTALLPDEDALCRTCYYAYLTAAKVPADSNIPF